MDDAIDCVFHHGGKFINDGTLKYEGETTTLSFDSDMWSYFMVVHVVKGFRYDNFKELWYCVGEGLVLENRLEQLIDDTDAMHMANLSRLNGEVHVYIVHVVSKPEVIHMLEYITNDQGQVEGHGEVQKEVHEGEEDGDGVEVDGEGDGHVQEMHEGEEDGDGFEVEGEGDGHVQEVHEVEEDGDGVEVECEDDGHVQEVHEGEEDVHGVEVEVEGDGDGDKEQELNMCEGVVEEEVDLCSWSKSIDEGGVHGNSECIEGLIDVGVECDINGNVKVEVESLSDSSDNKIDDDDRGLSDEEWKSEELLSAIESDEEVNDSEGYGRFGMFCMPKSMVDFTWEVGTSFAEKQDILDVVKGYALENGRNIKPIIGLDGAFLKVKYGDELLIAVVRDENDQIFPIAYAVVKVENKDSWSWFLNLLIDDLGGEEVYSSITFVSDQQKAIVIFNLKYPGKNLKRLMWRAAATTHPQTWEMEMRNIKDVNEDTFKHLIVIPPRRWSITGISCCHSLAAMKFLNIDGEQFIPTCFMKSTYEETYASIVYPINGNNMWELIPYPDVMPPRKKVMLGRPKKKRRLEQWKIRKDDSRLSKAGLRKIWRLCREVGYNRSRSSKQPKNLPMKLPNNLLHHQN
ncbi:uncharacterized protein LOC108324487 [Vigna angularis]|uniref:uncharacterized protein LOC108324487 n=1 Tax=Phaseolus angularis TaxID=3914 RepID=UPI000809AA1F|nr:uncharacterized protein LOC108324487 [Vigna angularis]